MKQEQLYICPKAKECNRECTDKMSHPKSKGCRDKRLYPTFSDGSVCPACIPYEPDICPDCATPIDGGCLMECTGAKKCNQDCLHRITPHPEGIGLCSRPCGEHICKGWHPADLQPEKHLICLCMDDGCGFANPYCPIHGEQPTPTMPLREQFETALEIAACSGCGNRGSSAYTNWDKDLCRACEVPTRCTEIVKDLVKMVQAHDSEVASKAVKEFAEKVIATMPINNQVKKQRVLMIAHIRAMAEGGA